MGRYDDDSSDADDYEEDFEVAAIGPLSLDFKPSKYENRERSRSRSRSKNRYDDDCDSFLEEGRRRGRSRERNEDTNFRERSRSNGRKSSRSRSRSQSRASARSRSSVGKHSTMAATVYSNRNVLDNEADVVGMCVYNDVKELKTWRTAFTVTQVFAGMSVMVTRIPEVTSYAYIAGIDPFIALQATWIMNVITPIVGGRPGLHSGMSGLGSIVIRHLVREHGSEYVYYVAMLSGLIQMLFATFRIGKYLRIMPAAVTIGLLNGLCILLHALQLRYFKEFPNELMTVSNNTTETTDATIATSQEDKFDMPWSYFYGYDLEWTSSISQICVVAVEALVAMLICMILPSYIKILPAALVALAVTTGVNIGIRQLSDWDAPTIGDYYVTEIPTSRLYQGIFHPSIQLPDVFTWETISAVVPAGVSLACLSLIETLVTINVTDTFTSTDSYQDRVFFGQGIANFVSGFMGGMGGAASPFGSIHLMKEGGLSSISSFLGGIYLFLIMIVAYPIVAMVPLGAAAGIALYLILNLIQWSPFFPLVLRIIPKKCVSSTPAHLRLSIPDLFATFLSSWMVLFSTIYGLAGYLVGVLCYACDPIAHAIFFNSNENITLMQLNVSSTGIKPFLRKKKDDDTESSMDEDPYVRPAPLY